MKMDCLQAQALAESLMRQWQLHGWNLDMPYGGWGGRRPYWAGRCSHRDRTIRLSLRYVTEAAEEHVRNTVLHEISHALVGPGNIMVGSGEGWHG
jgi:hypothetical protein